MLLKSVRTFPTKYSYQLRIDKCMKMHNQSMFSWMISMQQNTIQLNATLSILVFEILLC